MQTKVAVIYIVYNRPNLTKITFKAIQKYKPKKLFIVCDGPKNVFDKTKVEAVQKLVNNIDWKCDVYKNYSKINLGCKKRVVSGINWAFNFIDCAIILEDDCLASGSFFKFCETALRVFYNKNEVMHISGSHLLDKNMNPFFSKYPYIWGWATWKRAWKNYSIDVNFFKNSNKTSFLKKKELSISEKYFWEEGIKQSKKKNFNNWDTQWVAAIWNNYGVSLNPGMNLVSNIGFGKNATHTKETNSFFSNMPLSKANINFKKMISEREIIKENTNIDEKIFKISFYNDKILAYNYFSYVFLKLFYWISRNFK